MSETHSLRNVKRTHQQMLDEARAIVALLRQVPAAQRPKFEGGLSTAFGCTLEGPVPEQRVVALAEALLAAGCDEVGLADTSGYANPTQVKRLTQAVWRAVGRQYLSGIHLHNTRGQGLANVVAALDVGLTTVDASLAGLGGCPFAPGASGNVATEDVAMLLEQMGFDTGIDLDALVRASDLAEELTGTAPGGRSKPWLKPKRRDKRRPQTGKRYTRAALSRRSLRMASGFRFSASISARVCSKPSTGKSVPNSTLSCP